MKNLDISLEPQDIPWPEGYPTIVLCCNCIVLGTLELKEKVVIVKERIE
jgi:hypothetical protein